MNRLADFVLKYPANIQKAINDKREDMCLPKTGGGSSRHAFISDPTCQKAILKVMPVGTVVVEYGPKITGMCATKVLKNPEKWLDVVEETWKYYRNRPAAYKLMVMRYREGNENMYSVAKELNISVQRCYVILNDIHTFVIERAKGCGAFEERRNRQIETTETLVKKIEKKEDENIFVN